MNLRGLFDKAEDAHDYAAGEVVFAEGSPGDVMYVVLDGEVEIRAGDAIVDTLGPGDVLGEMALIEDKPRSATATATSGCRLAPVDQRRFLFLVEQTPFFAIHVMRILAERVRRMNTLLGP